MYSSYYFGSPSRHSFSLPKNNGLGQKYPEDIQCVHYSGNPIKGSIYISNVEAAQNAKTLQKYGIKAIMTCARGYDRNIPKHKLEMFQYFPFDDKQTCIISPYLDKACDFIAKALQKTNILVHCIAGVSRSVSMVLAFFIRQKKMTYEQAYKILKSRRSIISPNDGFIRQLKQYAKQIKNKMNSNSISLNRQLTPQKKLINHSVLNQLKQSKTIQRTKTSDYSQYLKQQNINNQQDCIPRSKTFLQHNHKNQSDLLHYSYNKKPNQEKFVTKNNSVLVNRNLEFQDHMYDKTPQKLIKKESVQSIVKEKKQQFDYRAQNYKEMNQQLNKKIQEIHAKYEKQRQQLLSKRGYSSNSKRQKAYNYQTNSKSSFKIYDNSFDLKNRYHKINQNSYSYYKSGLNKYADLYQNKYQRGLQFADLRRTTNYQAFNLIHY